MIRLKLYNNNNLLLSFIYTDLKKVSYEIVNFFNVINFTPKLEALFNLLPC